MSSASHGHAQPSPLAFRDKVLPACPALAAGHRCGLTDATWVPLVHLKQTGGGITQKELAALVGVEGSSLVRVLDILAREGLIERRRDESEGRANLIHLTPEGEHRVGEIRRELARVESAMLSELSDGDIAAMLTHFETIERRMSDLDGMTGKAEHP